MNRSIPTLIMSFILTTFSFASNDPVDIQELRKAYKAKVETKQLSFYLNDDEVMNKAVLESVELDSTSYDLPEFDQFHTLACQWLKRLGGDKITVLAEALRDKTKQGDVISGPERKQRLQGKIFGKSAKKILGKGLVQAMTEVAVAGDQVYGWASALQLYEDTITRTAEQKVCPIYVSMKMHSKGSTIKFTDYVVRLSARYIYLCKIFVDGKMKLFDELPRDPIQNNNNI